MRNKIYMFLALTLLCLPLMGNTTCTPVSETTKTSTTTYPDYDQEERPTVPIPEPTAAILFGAGLVGAGIYYRRRRDR